MLYRTKFAVCFEINTKHKRNVRKMCNFGMLKLAVHTVTDRL